MKRSEMVEEIRKILAMNGKDNGYGELEEAILHHIEHFNMQPPRRMAKTWSEIGIPDCSQLEAPRFMVNMWEAENE
jgi:hypothetical protein